MATITVYRTATIPATADTDTLRFTDGSIAVTAGLDLSALTEGLTKCVIARQWTADIGSTASPFLTDVDAGTGIFINNSGGGTLYYKPTGDNNLCLKYIHNGFGSAVMTGGTFTKMEVANGKVVVGSSCVITNLDISGGQVFLQGNAGTAPTLVRVFGGAFSTERATTTLTMSGGTSTLNATSAATTINVYGGTVNIQRSGTITAFNLFSGNALNFNIGTGITVTDSTFSSKVPGAADLSHNEAITYTNATTWLFGDGKNY